MTLVDDIATFLPGIELAEYDRRARLRTYRNVAAAIIGQSESPTARQLAWLASDYCFELGLAPASAALLDDVGKLCQRMLICAAHAERLELIGAD